MTKYHISQDGKLSEFMYLQDFKIEPEEKDH